uniref:Uncharacterized protein n=1 Tax=Prevotella sp. GTC17254 TaxID=3236794 RepID=A0AB33J1F4_9BACT
MLQSQDSTAAKALQFFKFEESESATGQKTPQRKETAQKRRTFAGTPFII